MSELYKLLTRQSCFIKQQEFFKTQAKEILCCSLDLLDKLDTQEQKEKKEKEDKVASTIIQLAATAAVQPTDPPGFSSAELLEFESSF
jgi:hypothetical protein